MIHSALIRLTENGCSSGLERGDRLQSWAEVWSLFVLLNWQCRSKSAKEWGWNMPLPRVAVLCAMSGMGGAEFSLLELVARLRGPL